MLYFKWLTLCLHLHNRDKCLSASVILTRSLCSPLSSPKECKFLSRERKKRRKMQDQVAHLRCFFTLLHPLSTAMSKWGQLNATEARTLVYYMCYCEYKVLKARTSSALSESTFFVEISFLTVWNETHYYQLTCCEPKSLAELSIIIHP